MGKPITTKTIVTKAIPELTGMVTVIGTGAGFLKAGIEYPVSAELAKTLINNNSATLKTD